MVENKSGAATGIGATYFARAPKDGYTLLLAAGTPFTVLPNLNDKLLYKLDDLEPVGLVCTMPFAFVVKKDFPARTVKEFAAYAQANPGKINNATNGQGSRVHRLGELIATGLDVKLTQVHCKGAAPVTMDMIGSSRRALPRRCARSATKPGPARRLSCVPARWRNSATGAI